MELIGKDKIEKFREGDHKAFDEIFLGYFNKIKNFINGLIKSEEDSEELTQDIFVKLWINRKEVNPDKSFNSYLFTIAKNSTLNYIRHQHVRQTYINDYNQTDYYYSNDVEDKIFAKEIDLLIEMIVERMPERRKEIYTYSRIRGYSNEEIAEKLNISKKTVENQLSLALKEIRETIYVFVLLFFSCL